LRLAAAPVLALDQVAARDSTIVGARQQEGWQWKKR